MSKAFLFDHILHGQDTLINPEDVALNEITPERISEVSDLLFSYSFIIDEVHNDAIGPDEIDFLTSELNLIVGILEELIVVKVIYGLF